MVDADRIKGIRLVIGNRNRMRIAVRILKPDNQIARRRIHFRINQRELRADIEMILLIGNHRRRG